jgi:hypothetical protein
MDALCAAIPVARSLLRAADSGAPRTLTIAAAGAKRARLRLESGRVWEVNGVDDEPLGDALLSRGELDPERHRAALAMDLPAGRVGRWLVSVGAASERSVRAALTQQLSRRVESVLRWRGAELLLTTSAPPLLEGLHVSAPLAMSVHVALVRIASELPADVLRVRASSTALRATTLGHWLAPRLGLVSGDEAFAALLAAHPGAEQLAARAALRAIGALVEQNAEFDGYSLLLRKRRELRGRASARRLLDLPEEAHPSQARVAFRKLARKLHPDRFHATQPSLTDLSNEVMCALVSAEAELSAEGARGVRCGR